MKKKENEIININQIFNICFHLFQTCTTCLQEEIRLFENIYLQFQSFIFIISFSFFFIGQVFLNFLEHVGKKNASIILICINNYEIKSIILL
jgi:hypothetical protein